MNSGILITLRNVSAGKAGRPVINNLDWTIRKNEQWAVTGPNGSGKSTLLSALAGELPWRSGSQVYHFLPKGHYRDEYIELVPERYTEQKTFQNADVYYQQRFNAADKENSPLVKDFLLRGFRSDKKNIFFRIRFYRIAKLFGIRKHFRARLFSLSNGEMKRLFLMRAFLHKKPIVLLDRPFNGLDVSAREILNRTIGRMAKRGTTIIITAAENEIPGCVNRILNLPGPDEAQVGLPDISRIEWPAVNTADHGFKKAVSLRDITVVYDGKKILDKINWEIAAGERWALLGPNGSGKSTLLSLICGDNPQAYANDFDLFDKKRGSGESIWDIKKRIGFVSPELHIYFPGELTVFKTAASGLRGGGFHTALTDEEKSQTSSCLELLGLAARSDTPFRDLSSGEQRLSLLARALVNRPPVLVLDEPCQGLDEKHRDYFVSLIDHITRTANLTLIYVTHKQEEIPPCVDNVLRMDKGRGKVFSCH